MNQVWLLLAAAASALLSLTHANNGGVICADKQRQCGSWSRYCFNNDYVIENCVRTCHRCPRLSETREAQRRQQQLQSLKDQQAATFARQSHFVHQQQRQPRFFAAPPLLHRQQQQQQQQFSFVPPSGQHFQQIIQAPVQHRQQQQGLFNPSFQSQQQHRQQGPIFGQPIQLFTTTTTSTTSTSTMAITTHGGTTQTMQPPEPCENSDKQCNAWVSSNFNMCTQSPYIKEHCQKRCGYCGRAGLSTHPEYDLRRLPRNLEPIAFLLGRWRTEHAGKARFPTIPVFTYGEEISFSISDDPRFGAQSLNYTAFAFGINEAKELHSEYGFLAVRNGSDKCALTTVMNNGFTTVEEGRAIGGSLRLRLQDIGRISFSRDLPVSDMVREFRLIDSDTLEQKLDMQTVTHGMQEHTFIRYKKIFP